MQTAKQISVSLENKPGRLANVLTTLAREKVNITGLTVMDSHDHSVLRFVADDPVKSIRVLKDLGLRHVETDVLLVELRHQPGALAHVCSILAAEHINIDYCYVSSGGRNGRVYGIFKVSNHDKAMRVLNGSPNERRERRPLRDQRVYKAPSR
ncbi:MAG: ACT domain-containing protein [Gemmataceae bacterium]|nr:ACT domain-containing protein [Gemmataceae bacterium]MDW8266235.1 ACT domain-containing protein [Gemmataceae bacterium]